MRRGRNIALVIFVLVLLAGLGGLSYRLFTRGSGAAGPSVGGPFTLVDGDGRTVTERSFPGKFLLIYFGYTHCPDACPTALSNVSAALDRVGARAALVQPLFITVDPERDTQAAMKDYAAAFGAGLVGLTGPPAEIKTVEHEYRVYAEKQPTKDGDYAMDHTSIIYLMDPQGQALAYFTQETKVDDIAAKLAQLVPPPP